LSSYLGSLCGFLWSALANTLSELCLICKIAASAGNVGDLTGGTSPALEDTGRWTWCETELSSGSGDKSSENSDGRVLHFDGIFFCEVL